MSIKNNNKKKVAFITGISGQDGSYLAELLIEKGYEVHGLVKKVSQESLKNIYKIKNNITLHVGDAGDMNTIEPILCRIKPIEIYSLACSLIPGNSFGKISEKIKLATFGSQIIYEIIAQNNIHTKIFHASSSEIFGKVKDVPQNENTEKNPQNPYGVAKLYSYNIAKVYRDKYNLYISTGILYGHESVRRKYKYFVMKIAYAAACLKMGIKTSKILNEIGEPIVFDGKIKIGNLYVKRDWGYSKDFVCAYWKMLQQKKPDDFIIGTGHSHSVKDVCEMAFSAIGENWQDYIEYDSQISRKLDPIDLVADITKAKSILGWGPTVTLNEIMEEMIDYNIRKLSLRK